MNTRAFSLALIIAVFAMFMVYTYIEDQTSIIIKKYGEKVPVVIAKEDIKELDLIDDSKVSLRTVPESFVEPGSFRSIKEVENTIATVPIVKGEQITKTRLTYPSARTGLSRQVSIGKRALAINITEKQAVSKLIKPGDRVDVLAAIDYASGRRDLQKVRTVLQDILVLSTGMSVTNSIPLYGVKTPKVIKKMNVSTYVQYNTVTLELTPYQVQKLVFLLNYSGSPPYLSLRNNKDKEVVRINSSNIYDVVGEEELAKARSFFAEKYSTKRKTR